MVRATNARAVLRSKKRLLKRAKGFVGDRKNHHRLAADAVMAAMAFNTKHRKRKKRDFRRLWTIRIGVATKMHGISYSKFIHGLKKANCQLNRKILAEMAIHDPTSFGAVVGAAKQALA
jgi:large subunit ribosomal protein L20